MIHADRTRAPRRERGCRSLRGRTRRRCNPACAGARTRWPSLRASCVSPVAGSGVPLEADSARYRAGFVNSPLANPTVPGSRGRGAMRIETSRPATIRRTASTWSSRSRSAASRSSTSSTRPRARCSSTASCTRRCAIRELRLRAAHAVARRRPARRAGDRPLARSFPAAWCARDRSACWCSRTSTAATRSSICVPVDTTFPYYSDVGERQDLPSIVLQQIEHFFKHYKDLEAGEVGQRSASGATPRKRGASCSKRSSGLKAQKQASRAAAVR